MLLASTLELQAGGAGSGRHPEAGKFEHNYISQMGKGSRRIDVHTFKSPTTKVSVWWTGKYGDNGDRGHQSFYKEPCSL